MLPAFIPIIYAVPCGSDIFSKLDLMVACQMQGTQERRYYLKIINHSNAPVYYSTANLSIKLWVYEPVLRCASITGQNGEVYNSSGTRIGNVQIEGNTYSDFTAVEYFQESAQHKANQVVKINFNYAGGEVSYIPAGGWVQGFQVMVSASCSFLSDLYRPLYASLNNSTTYSDASCYITFASSYGLWTDFSDDYSGLPFGQSDCSGNMVGPYYDDHHFALYSNNVLVAEYKTASLFDTETGLPPGAGDCTATVTRTSTKTPTSKITMTTTKTVPPTETPTFTETDTLTATSTYTITDSPTYTYTATPTVTMTITKTVTQTITKTVTLTMTETVTRTVTDTATSTITWTITDTITDTETQTMTETVTYTVTDTITDTVTPTATNTITPTMTQTVTPTIIETLTITVTCTSTPVHGACYALAETMGIDLSTLLNALAMYGVENSGISPIGACRDSNGDIYLTVNGFIPAKNIYKIFASQFSAVKTVLNLMNISDIYIDQVVVLDSSGKLLRQWGKHGNTNGEFNIPGSIAISPGGDVYVWDFGNSRIQIFSRQGQFINSISAGTPRENVTAANYLPAGIGFDTEGYLYFADGISQISKYDAQGGMVASWQGVDIDGTRVAFSAPNAIALDAANNVFISDSGNRVVRVVSSSNNYIKSIGENSLVSPRALMVDEQGYCFVVDTSSVKVFTPQGDMISTAENPQMHKPSGITLDPAGNIYVTNTFGYSLFKYSPCGVIQISPTPEATAVVLQPLCYQVANRFGSDLEYPFGGVAVDTDGKIYLADIFTKQVSILNQAGAQTNYFMLKNNVSADPMSSYGQPSGLAISAAGSLFITDILQLDAQSVSKTGEFGFMLYGSPDKNFKQPSWVAVDDANDRIYITDVQNYRVSVFDRSGNPVGTMGELGGFPGQFISPSSVAVDHSGNIYVADMFSGIISKFDKNRNFVRRWGGFGIAAYGGTEGKSAGAGGIAAGPDNRIFVLDVMNERVQVFSPDGDFIQTIRAQDIGGAVLKYATGIFVDNYGSVYVSEMARGRLTKIMLCGEAPTLTPTPGVTPGITVCLGTGVRVLGGQDEPGLAAPVAIRFANNGNLLVLSPLLPEYDRQRVSEFDGNGVYINSVVLKASPDNYTSFAQAPDGKIYVVNEINSNIEVYADSGEFLKTWGTAGMLKGQMNTPMDIIIDGKYAYISDTQNFRVQVYDLNGGFIKEFGRGAGFFEGQLGMPSRLTMAPDHSLFALDSFNNFITKFGPDNIFATRWNPDMSDGYAATRIKCDPAGRIWAVEPQSNMIRVYDGNGHEALQITAEQLGLTDLNAVTDLAFDASGNLYFAVASSGLIMKYDLCGNELATPTMSPTPAATQCLEYRTVFNLPDTPLCMAVGPQGVVYTCYIDCTIIKSTAAGVFLVKFGGHSDIDADKFKSIGGITCGADGSVYVSDPAANLIKKFSANGDYITSWGAVSGSIELSTPSGMAAGPDGYIYAADTGNNRVLVFDGAGNKIRSIGASGLLRGQLTAPGLLTFDTSGRLIIYEPVSGRINIYTKEGGYISSFKENSADSHNIFTAVSIAVNPVSGLIYLSEVTQESGNRVRVFNPSGDMAFDETPAPSADRFIIAFKADGELLKLSAESGLKMMAPCGAFFPTATPVTGMDSCWTSAGSVSLGGLTALFPANLVMPDMISSDPAGNNIYAINCNYHAVVSLNRHNNSYTLIGSSSVYCPSAITSDETGNIIVADPAVNNVKIYSPEGALAGSISGNVTPPGDFGGAAGVAAYNGELFISDGLNKRIQVLDYNGGYLRTIGSGSMGTYIGQFTAPGKLCIQAGELYAADGSRIQVFSTAGTPLRNWFTGAENVRDIKVSANGYVFIALVKGGVSSVQVYNTAGDFVMQAGPDGATAFLLNPDGSIMTGSAGATVIQNYVPCNKVTPSIVGLSPDLVVTGVNINTTGDWQALHMTGTLTASVSNSGDGATDKIFKVLFFEDMDHDGKYTAGSDRVFGTASVTGIKPGEIEQVSIPADSDVLFRENLVYVFVDSGMTVPESNENNNYGNSGSRCSALRPARVFDPVLFWKWDYSQNLPYAKAVQANPIVADLDHDGSQEVVFITSDHAMSADRGILRAVNGATKAEVFTVTNVDYRVNTYYEPAAADIDGDGKVEIIAVTGDRTGLIAFNYDGTFRWKSEKVPDDRIPETDGRLSISDLGDGRPSIIMGNIVFDTDGKIRWMGDAASGTAKASLLGTASIAADINLDNSLEVICGNTVYDGNGTVLWKNTQVPDGMVAVGKFGSDPNPGIVLAAQGKLWLLGHNGNIVWGPVQAPGIRDYEGGLPIVGDFNGDGKAEIGVGYGSSYCVFNGDGTLLWKTENPDATGVAGFHGSTAYDFDGDGVQEILYQDEKYLYVYNGANGTTLMALPMEHRAYLNCPVVADVDNDHHAEIVAGAEKLTASGNSGLYVFKDRLNKWQNVSPMWNQHSYHITNILPDGSIPKFEKRNWEIYNSFRENGTLNECSSVWPDLTASYLRVSNSGGNMILTARIGNAGSDNTPAGVSTAFYGGDPSRNGNLLGTVRTTGILKPGYYEDVFITIPARQCTAGTVWVSADDTGYLIGEVDEISELNNVYNSGVVIAAQCTPSPVMTLPVRQFMTVTPAPTSIYPPTPVAVPSNGVYYFSSGADDFIEVKGYCTNAVVVEDPISVWSRGTGAPWIGYDMTGGSEYDSYLSVTYWKNIYLPPGTYNAHIKSTADDIYTFSINGVKVGECDGPCFSSFQEFDAQVTSTGVVSLDSVVKDTGGCVTGLSYMVCFTRSDIAPAYTWTPTQEVTQDLTPGTPTATMTVTMTCTATSTITPANTVVPGAYGFMLNCAGDAMYTDPAGRTWNADDRFYCPGSYGYYDAYDMYSVDGIVTGTDAGSIYGDVTESDKEMEYRFDVAPGDYSVKLFMAEYYYNTPGIRIFDVYIEGVKVLEDLDLYARAGYMKAYEPEFTAHVIDGTLNIVFRAKKDNATIAGIAITGLQAQATPTVTWTPAVGIYEARIDCASQADYTSGSGKVWDKDRAYRTAGSGYVKSGLNVTVGGSEEKICGTVDGVLYSTFAKGQELEYAFDVPSGKYTVGMFWSELEFMTKGLRQFDVYIEGNKVISKLDVADVTNYSCAYSKYFSGIDVTDGTLSIKFTGVLDNAMISAIEVIGEQPMPTSTVTPTSTSTASASTTDTETITGTPPTSTVTPTSTQTAVPSFIDLVRLERPDGTPVDFDGSTVTRRVNVVGSVRTELMDHWVLEYKLTGSSEWSALYSSVSQVDNAILATFDPSMMLNGIYQLKLTLYETNGETTSITSPAFVVEGNLKVGNFTMSFTDMSVPVGGVSMDIVRTYDSRVKTGGDFGIGWTLDIKNIRVEESCIPGKYWNDYFDPIIYSQGLLKIRSLRSHIVAVTIPGGKVYRFEAVVTPNHYLTGMGGIFNITYQQIGGAGALLKPVDSKGSVSADGEVPGNFTFSDNSTYVTYDPNVYELTTQDGTKYVIDQTAGLKYMTDLNGNKLTIDNAGVHYSHGGGVVKEILFQRDGAGRITKVTDPEGHNCAYTYDTNGDLTEFKDRVQTEDSAKGKVTYTYYPDGKHNLKDISDPRNSSKKPITNYYDDSGRLTKNIDAYGNEIDYTHDIEAKTEAVKDRNNNTTTYTYDERGNVLTLIDALWHATTYTYDQYDNKTSETIAGGTAVTYEYSTPSNHLMTAQVDALGNRTVYTYDDNGRVLTTTDPRGYVTTNYYSTTGNLMWVMDAKGNYTYYNYDTAGNMTYMKDAEGNETTYAYDGSGNQTSQTQCGVTTSWTYDNDGNRITETKPAAANVGGTVTTKYDYDGDGRIIDTIYAYGTAMQTEISTVYDSLGKAVVRTDAKNRSIQTTYDDMGRVDTVIYPDSSKKINKYDAEGRLTWVGNYDRSLAFKCATTNVYDAAGRKTDTYYPDNATSHTSYDAQGRVQSETGEDGVVTSYTYYANGNRQTMNCGGYSVSYMYDPNGNQTDETDMNGTVHTVYDELNRAIETDYPNSTHRYVGYDKLGRKTQDTDEENKVTGYAYNCNGNINSVTQSISGRILATAYGYDDAGNQINQADAKNNNTTYRYDIMNRRIQKALPGGQFETYHYDNETGKVDYKVDFNKTRTDYTYDSDTDVLTDENGGGKIVTNTYDNSNRVANVNISEGDSINMSFTYDVMDRIITKTTPWDMLTYTRVPGGKIHTITTVKNYNVEYDYDPFTGLLTQRKDGTDTTAYIYDPINNLKTMTLPNGLVETYTYNAVNKLTNILVSKSGATIASWDYTLGPSGNKTAAIENSGRALIWVYDDLYRLTNEGITASITNNIGYVYDDTGNRDQRSSDITVIPAQTFSYDPDDRIQAYNWDNNGNLLNDGTYNYTWNAKNELKRVRGTGVDVEYFYDGDGLRVSRKDNVSGLVTYYVWDTENPTGYPQVVEEIEGGQVVRRYGYGLFLETIDIKNGSIFDRFYVIRDGTNSVRMLLDSAGNISATYDYDAFGNVLSATNANPITVGNSFGFHSEYKDQTTGLIYLRARWYEPSEGRFVRMDRSEGQIKLPITKNKYISFNDNPANVFDPTGLEGITGPTGKRITELLQGTIIKELGLEDENTETGIVERLFLSEIRSPWYSTYSDVLASRSFRLLGALLNNRKNDGRWHNTIWDVITDTKFGEQFKGFSTYPKLLKYIDNTINDVVTRAGDETMPKHKEMRKHLNLVKLHAMVTVSGFIQDPYNGNTLYMREKGTGKPKKDAVELETIMDNTFYGE
jgi:RHS repeat-associated protein